MNDITFTSLRLGPIEVGNRLALAPVKTALGGTDGIAGERMRDGCGGRQRLAAPS